MFTARFSAKFPARVRSVALVLALVSGGSACGASPTVLRVVVPPTPPAPLGVTADPARDGLCFRVASTHATRIELYVYAAPLAAEETLHAALTRDPSGIFALCVPRAQLPEPVYYGYRAWGPNWLYDPAWHKGSTAGFVAHVDPDGNRYDPNKLLIDPYAREVSHDPVLPGQREPSLYQTGAKSYALDSGALAPKSIVVAEPRPDVGERPLRALGQEIIYEVHLRGLTQADAAIPAALRGTYAGAALKVPYLRSLGVTAVEFLPVAETQNEHNDLDPAHANYWGYAPLAFFAPDRRYAADQTPGGPTREFAAMVKTFHDGGLKVYLDVVYNHTGEDGLAGADPTVTRLYSWRGLDNAGYYELDNDPTRFFDVTGTGANFNAQTKLARDLILDAQVYWSDVLGVDGFRYDLAPVLANRCARGCFAYDRDDPQSVLSRAVVELPVRPLAGGAGVDLIGEPWAAGTGYEVGNLPPGWSEWNGRFRDDFRKAQNEDTAQVPPGRMAVRLGGSPDLYRRGDRTPAASINFLSDHDGYTLRDLYSCGRDNDGWDQGGDEALQRQAARTGLALVMLAAGVPMFGGGDELGRTLSCNENPFNIDSAANWLDWSAPKAESGWRAYAVAMVAFRGAHRAALAPSDFAVGRDHNGDGVPDVSWYTADGQVASARALTDPTIRFLGMRLDGSERDDSALGLYVAYSRAPTAATIVLPTPRPGAAWALAIDTSAALEAQGNVLAAARPLAASSYEVAGRSLAVFIEQ
jgi:glycogen operon protein